jgi:hypothetical protein
VSYMQVQHHHLRSAPGQHVRHPHPHPQLASTAPVVPVSPLQVPRPRMWRQCLGTTLPSSLVSSICSDSSNRHEPVHAASRTCPTPYGRSSGLWPPCSVTPFCQIAGCCCC